MKQIKILSLGDDSLRVALSYLPKIAKSDSVGVVSGILYAEDATSDSFLQKIRNDSREFTFVYNKEGSVRFNTVEDFSAAKAFDWFDWNFVVISDSDAECVDEICAFVRERSPKTKIIINRTVAEDDENVLSLCNADMDFSVTKISTDAKNEISKQGFVTDMNSGRIKDFLSACILYENLTGNNVADNKYRLPFVESEITEIIKTVVHRNCAKG